MKSARGDQLGHGRSALVNMVRYADGFIVTGRSKDLLESEVKPLVTDSFKARGLELSPETEETTAESLDQPGRTLLRVRPQDHADDWMAQPQSCLAGVRGKR
jgi:hypothetical protein